MALLLTREFWRPSVLKISVFVALAAFQAYTVTHSMMFDGVMFVGFPFGFYPVGTLGWFMKGPYPTVSYAWFVVDLVCWYAFACGAEKLLRRFRRA